MNKKLQKSLFAVVLAVAGIFAISHYSAAAVNGDVTGDGAVTAADVTAVYDILLGNNTEYEATADVNGDGSVTAADVTFIYDILLGNTPQENEHVYILGNAAEWTATQGQEMTTEDGVIYTATLEAQNVSDGYSWFGFTTKLADATSETPWDDIAAYRFGAVSEGDFLVTNETLGTAITLTKEGYQAFQIAAGKYELSLNLNEMTLVITKVEEPQPETQVWILGEVNGNSWDPTTGVEMTTEDGNIFTAQITTRETGYSYFSFTKKLAEATSETPWDDIADYRFGALGEDANFLVTEEMLGTELPMTDVGYLAYQMAPGTFNLSLNLETMKLTITGEFTPQPQPENNWYLIGTNNGWSTSDMSYKFTQSTENENVYSIHVDNVSGEFWFKIANEDCYTAGDFWSGTILSFANNGVNPLSGNLVQGNQGGAFCLPANYNATYLDITIDVENFTYSITTDGQEPQVDPTAEYDYLYIAGDADNWAGNGGKVASVKDANDYYGFFTAGTKFKFQKFQGDWGTNWGGSNGTLVAGGADIEASGLVYVNANLNSMTYSITNITSMGIIGDAFNADWATEAPLTYNAETGAWEATGVVLTAGSIKFRANGNWDINFGGALDNLTINGENITVEAGTYNVSLKLVCPGEYTATLTPAN